MRHFIFFNVSLHATTVVLTEKSKVRFQALRKQNAVRQPDPLVPNAVQHINEFTSS